MELNEFSKEMLDSIKDAAKTSLLKLGVKVDFNVEIVDGHVEILSSEFNTTPVIYRAIRVGGCGLLIDDTLNISLDYLFDYFNGGTNGVRLGYLKFRVNYTRDKRPVIFCAGLTI